MKLFIVVDDMTGALDTAVQLAQAGASTAVFTGYSPEDLVFPTDVEVVAVNAETRHLPPRQAYDRVCALTRRALEAAPLAYLYKKTDSTLRGNIGSELTAMLDASGDSRLVFVPALPVQNRTTEGGVQYVNGMPIHMGISSLDPLELPACSCVPDIISAQSKTPTVLVPRGCYATPEEKNERADKRILIYDGVTDGDIRAIGASFAGEGIPRVMAGSAGFATVLPDLLSLSGERPAVSVGWQKLVVVCGSVNPMAQAQLRYGQEMGFHRLTLSASDVLGEAFSEKNLLNRAAHFLADERPLIIDANDRTPGEKMDLALALGMGKAWARERIAGRLGVMAGRVQAMAPGAMLVFIGGDTLGSYLKQMGRVRLTPLREITPGAVLSLVETERGEMPITTKAGGFGEADWLKKLREALLEK